MMVVAELDRADPAAVSVAIGQAWSCSVVDGGPIRPSPTTRITAATPSSAAPAR